MKFLPASALCLILLIVRAFAQEETVRVEFVDSATKTVFAVSEMSPGKLPGKFTAGDVLAIKGEKWMVLSADPAAKSDFVKTGKLTLVLSKAGDARPGRNLSTLFSMPTISGGIGSSTGAVPAGAVIIRIHEDDWRQVEFVSTSSEKDIDAEFADIHNVRVNERQPGGYSDLFVRERIPAPVRNCALRGVRELIPAARKLDAVGYLHESGIVPHSFAWAVDASLVIWGIAGDDGNVTQLCLIGAPRKENIAAISAALSRLTLKYDLYLVDWCKETRVHGSESDFEKYFGQ